jgi:Xaa-Pro dipeptidase
MRRRELLSRAIGCGAAAAVGCTRSPGSAVAAPSGGACPPAPTPEPAPSPLPGRFSELEGFCAGVEAPSAAEHEERRERIRAAARDAGYAAVLVEAGTELEYLTGVRWGLSERPILYLLPVHGPAAFVGPAFEGRTLDEQRAGEGELHVWHEHESPYLATRAAARAAGIGGGRVAVDGAMRLFVFEGLRRGPGGLRCRAAPDVFAGCRMIKSERELVRLRRVNEATKLALRAAAAHVSPGTTEAEVAALVREAQGAAGLDQIWALALAGANASFPHGTRERRTVREGDLVLVDTGGALHGYRSDITRTWAVGRPDAGQRRAFETVLAAQSAALDAIRPGVRCEEIDAAARGLVEAAGFGRDYERFTHRLGHGIGLQVHEEPYLVRGNARPLRAGMTFSNEPGIYEPGRLGVRLEDIVAVTADGAEVFGPRAASLDEPFGGG